MKIQIIGLGIVGTAQAYLSQKLGYDVVGYDIRAIKNPYCSINENLIKDADITFICTPESVVDDVIQSLINIEYIGLIVVRSTLPIGDTKRLSEKFGIHICHNPEFLREKYYLDDILEPDAIVIGECCKQHGDMVESFYQRMNKPIVRVDTTKSEVIKLANNAYLSTLITFWNEINELCEKLDINPKDISNIISYDKRISNYGCDYFGKPFGGKCLPKDIVHLIEGYHEQGLNPKLFEACLKFNSHLTEKINKK